MLGSSQTGKNLNEMFSEIFNATGLDLQKVDYCEIGLKTIIVKPGEYDFDPVILVRSQQSLSGLISSVKQNKGLTYREETFGGKVITVLENPAKAGNNGGNNAGNQKTAGSGLKEIALLEIDSNTLALGSIARIKETAEGSSQVNSELISLLNPSAVVSFAGNSPSGMSKMIPLDNDDLGKAIDSIRLLSGYGDTKNGDLSLNITARTVDAKSAQSLNNVILGIKDIGKLLIEQAKPQDKQLFGKLLDTVQLKAAGNEVSMMLNVTSADVKVLMDRFLK
jgi:hypothetical protein